MKVAIMGCGKMGTWVANALRGAHELAVYDRHFGRAGAIKDVKIVKSLEEFAKFSPELFINAVNLSDTQAAFTDAIKFLPKDCIICDIASVKGGLLDFYKSSSMKFASVHPMFGPTFADISSLHGENAIIISESDRASKEFFRSFFSSLGLHVHELSFREHDDMMAYSLTLPFMSSLVFAACVDKTAVPGTTFARQLNVAKGLLSEDDSLLIEILFNEKSVAQIGRISSRLELLKHIIMAKDRVEAANYLAKVRANIGNKKSG